jgi:alpha-galactosidase
MPEPLPAAPVALHAGAGRIEAVRLGVRAAPRLGGGAEPPPCAAEFAADDLSPGLRRLGALEIELEREDHGDAATFSWSVRNAGPEELGVESVVLGLRWRPPAPAPLRFLRHGWQSWSYTGVRELDPAGEPPFPSGAWLRGMHHAVGQPAPDRAGWHESAIASVAGASPGGPACLAGVLETGAGFGVVYLRRDPDGVAVEVEVRLEVPLAPGEKRRLEAVRVALGDDASLLLERFAELWGWRAGARTRAPFQAGWCSWYHFFHDVRESDLLRNLEALAKAREDFPISVVQLDDGYQRAVGDWLETNDKFPRGLAPVAADIRAAGFTPGIWTAPFCVVSESRVMQAHGDWLLRDGAAPFKALAHPMWTAETWVYGLDTTRDDVLAHLRDLFRSLVELGFPYLKLDFLHAAAMRADASDPRATRAERLRRGLEAVREGAGPDAFLLGCGCPLGPAVGVVDGMRIGPDVAPSWGPDGTVPIPGLEPVVPSTGSALRSILHRAWMHRRLWLNDPDCLMARTSHTRLAPEEVRSLAAAVAATGGMVVFSDDVEALSPDDRRLVRETCALAAAVDAAGSRGTARAAGLLDGSGPALVAGAAPDVVVSALNADDAAARRVLSRAALRIGEAAPRALLGSAPPEADGDGEIALALAPHESALLGFADARELAVFCDFDGTFSVQDVGSTLARQHAGERRPLFWSRYEAGEITAWQYNLSVLDGLELPQAELDRFLEGIALDPGAAELVRWCEERGVPFRVLSDGFDWNLDRLQRIHGVRFAYDSNHLRYEGDRWRIAPGHPNPDCRCGTGTCKRGRIAAHRRAKPHAFCVHVGNGRVSDLCGALEADLCFAKDTLVGALEARGIAYEPFTSLRDVVAVLDRLWDGGGRGPWRAA